MRWVAVSILALGLAGTAYVTLGADQGSSRPPGVEVGNWFRLGERLGFVVVRGGEFPINGGDQQVLRAAPENLAADLLPPLKGYFVIQTPTGWRAVVMTEPVALAR